MDMGGCYKNKWSSTKQEMNLLEQVSKYDTII
jgi:hypothetical protein